MRVRLQVEIELRFDECQSGQKHEAMRRKAVVEQMDRVVQRMRVLEGTVNQIEVPTASPLVPPVLLGCFVY